MDQRLSVQSGRRVVPLQGVDLADFALVLSGYLDRRGTLHLSTQVGTHTVRVESVWGSYTVLQSDWEKVMVVLVKGLPSIAHLTTYEKVLLALTPIFS